MPRHPCGVSCRTAVDPDVLRRDPASGVAGQERDHGGDLGGLAEAPERVPPAGTEGVQGFPNLFNALQQAIETYPAGTVRLDLAACQRRAVPGQR